MANSKEKEKLRHYLLALIDPDSPESRHWEADKAGRSALLKIAKRRKRALTS